MYYAAVWRWRSLSIYFSSRSVSYPPSSPLPPLLVVVAQIRGRIVAERFSSPLPSTRTVGALHFFSREETSAFFRISCLVDSGRIEPAIYIRALSSWFLWSHFFTKVGNELLRVPGIIVVLLRGGIANTSRTYQVQYRQNPMYWPIFTEYIWSCLLWSPVIPLAPWYTCCTINI